MTGEPRFSAVKIALICADQLLCRRIRAEDKTSLWEIAGGPRQLHETYLECALRHVDDSLRLRLDPGRILNPSSYQNAAHPGDRIYFMVAIMTLEECRAAIEFDSAWGLMPLLEFINHPDADRQVQHRLAEYMSA